MRYLIPILIAFGCVDGEIEGDTTQMVSGADPGYTTCWSQTSACPVPATKCWWNVGYRVGWCSATPYANTSSTSCDGPEDCGFGQNCCVHYFDTLYGERYTGSCQSTQCANSPTYDSQNFELARLSGFCPAGQTSVRAGALVPGTFSVNHSGIPPHLWLCK